MAVDLFNRANESPLAAPWVDVSGLPGNALLLSGNAAIQSTLQDSGAYYTHVAYSEVTIGTPGNRDCGPALWTNTGAGSGYVLTNWNTGLLGLYRVDAQAYTLLDTATVANYVAGSKVSIRRAGSSIVAAYNGVDIIFTTDTTYTDLWSGLSIYDGQIDAWTDAAPTESNPQLRAGATSAYNSSSSSNPVVPVPTGGATGDEYIVSIQFYNGPGTITPPAGFTQAAAAYGVTSLYTYRRAHTGTEGATFTFTPATQRPWAAVCAIVTGGTYVAANAASATPGFLSAWARAGISTGSVTRTGANQLVVTSFASGTDIGSIGSVIWNESGTTRATYLDSTQGLALEVSSIHEVSAGSTSYSAAGYWDAGVNTWTAGSALVYSATAPAGPLFDSVLFDSVLFDTGATAPSSSVGAFGATESNDSLVSSGILLEVAAFAKSESADSASASATVPAAASFAVSEGIGSFAGAGVAPIAANLSASETLDSVGSTGALGAAAASAAFAVTETNDFIASASTLAAVAAFALSEAADSIASVSTLTVAATLARTEAADAVASSGSIPVAATLALAETSDLSSSASTLAEFGTLSAVEGADTFLASATLPEFANALVTEASDTKVLTGSLTEVASLSIGELGDTASAAGSSIVGIAGALALSEGVDTISASGALSEVGTLAAVQGADTFGATASSRSLALLLRPTSAT